MRQHTDRIKVGIIAIHNELLIVKQTVCVATAHVNLSGITRASDCLERHSHSFVVANFFSLSPFLISSLNLNLITILPTQDKHTPKRKQPVVVRIRV